MKSTLKGLAARRDTNLIAERRETSGKFDFLPQSSTAKSRCCKPQKTADPQKWPRMRPSPADRAATPPAVLEAILRAEIGESGVVRSLHEQPPQQLLANLKRSTGHFADPAKEGFPRRIKWRHVCGPELSPAQMTDYVETEEDLRLRNPRQPDPPRASRRASAATSVDGVPSDWKPCVPADHAALPDLAIPDFLRRTGGDQ